MKKTATKKTIVVDTSVLVFDPNCLESFENTNIIIPIQVVEELDKIKSRLGEPGKNARTAIRKLDKISAKGEIHIGIKRPKGNFIKIDTKTYNVIGEDKAYNDNKILGCAVAYKDKLPTLLSKDINFRIKARAEGILAEDWIKSNKTGSEFYTGITTVQNEAMIQTLLETGSIDCREVKIDAKYNQFIRFIDNENNEVCLGRKMPDDKIRQLKPYREAWGISPLNDEQRMAMDVLMDNSIPLVSLLGKAGSGKTIISLACAMELALNQKKFNKVVIYRPNEPVGKDIGFLPGTAFEKMLGICGAILDNFEVLFTQGDNKKQRNNKGWMQEFEYLCGKGLITLEPFALIRGRSIPNSIVLVDEAQNLSAADLKTMLTRIGRGSRVFLCGDSTQIDRSDLTESENAMTLAAEAFANSKLAAHITLEKVERSALAEETIKILG